MGAIPNYQGGANCANMEEVKGSDGQIYVKIYNDTGAALSNGAIYELSWEVDATDTSNPIIRTILKAPATEAVSVVQIAVVDNTPLGKTTIAAAEYGFVCIKGFTYALVDGTTDVAAGDQLEVLNAGTAFIQAAAATAGDAGTIIDETCAIAMEAYTSATPANKMVFMLGKQTVVKAA
jgi:hypothetical protein